MLRRPRRLNRQPPTISFTRSTRTSLSSSCAATPPVSLLLVCGKPPSPTSSPVHFRLHRNNAAAKMFGQDRVSTTVYLPNGRYQILYHVGIRVNHLNTYL